MIDHFIDNLVGDLKPVKPMNNSILAIICGICFVAILTYVVLTTGIRSDLEHAFKAGVLYWKNGGVLIGAIGALLCVIGLSRPQTNINKFFALPFVLILLVIIWQLTLQIPINSILHEVLNTNFGGATTCFSIIFGGGILGLFVVWQFWLKNTASKRPILLGFTGGILSASISAFAYSFHCNMDGAIYYLICYWVPIMTIGGIGAIFGKSLSW